MPIVIIPLRQSGSNNDEDSADRVEQLLRTLAMLTFGRFGQLADTTLSATEQRTYLKKPLRAYAFATSLECAQLFDLCRYKDEDVPCCELFHPVYTEHGFCYSFNGRFTDTPTTE